MNDVRANASARQALDAVLARRSISPKRIGPPAPTTADIETMLQAALRAPDHGGLRPWRVIEFRSEHREALADLFEAEKLRRDPLAGAIDRLRAREHALNPPALLAFVVSPKERARVPMREQWLSAGAALGNLLNAAHLLGHGAMILSGERCFDVELLAQLRIRQGEALAGFVSIGRVLTPPPDAAPALAVQRWSCWTPLNQACAEDGFDDASGIASGAP